jgi:hypothetical protein
MLSTIRSLRRGRGQRATLVVAVGFTSLFSARLVPADRLLWCINGIPEERLLYHDTPRHRLAVKGLWSAARVGRTPAAVLTVSHPMAELVRSRIGDTHAVVVPTVVDRTVFTPRPPGPGRLTYMGSGAPWQDLPLLASVWSALHELEPDLQFKVMTKDPRARVLAEALPPEAVEFVEARGPAAVAEQLRDTELGFVVRRPHVVNEVSYPTKFGEYVASGVGVVTTDIGWDMGELVRTTGCGVVLDVTQSPEQLAEETARFVREMRTSSGSLIEACDRAASTLDRERWVKQLGAALVEIVE